MKLSTATHQISFLPSILVWCVRLSSIHAFNLRSNIAEEEARRIGQVVAHGTKRTSTENAEVDVNGDSRRIGNLIDSWYFVSLSNLLNLESDIIGPIATEYDIIHPMQCPGDDNMCFGKFLHKGEGVTLLADNITNALRSKMSPSSQNFSLYSPHWIYWADIIELLHTQIGADLRKQMQTYANRYDPKLLEPVPLGHCVVHYRVGDLFGFHEDFGNAPQTLSPGSLADAVASFDPQPTVVEILSSGLTHESPHKVDRTLSLRLLDELKEAIMKKMPAAQIMLSMNGTTDEDFFKVATAPMVAFGPGSFSLAAGLAGQGNQIRSPAANGLLCTQCGERPPSVIRPGWTTYAYGLRDIP